MASHRYQITWVQPHLTDVTPSAIHLDLAQSGTRFGVLHDVDAKDFHAMFRQREDAREVIVVDVAGATANSRTPRGSSTGVCGRYARHYSRAIAVHGSSC